MAGETVCIYSVTPGLFAQTPTICHQIVAEHLDNFPFPPRAQITHYIDDFVVQAKFQEVVDQILPVLIQYRKEMCWEINPAKIQGLKQQVKFLGAHWKQGHREMLPKARQKFLIFLPHMVNRKVRNL